jgi:hypothetical protein
MLIQIPPTAPTRHSLYVWFETVAIPPMKSNVDLIA